jgi:ribosomal protein L29
MKKTFKEIKDKSIKELEKETGSLRAEIAKLNLEAKINPPKNTNTRFLKRKRLAVMLTVLGQKQELEKINKQKK